MSEWLKEEELKALSKDRLITLLVDQSKQSLEIQKQNCELLKQTKNLQEQLDILTQKLFGRRSEKNAQIPGQISLGDDGTIILNEAEALCNDVDPDEPETERVIVRAKKKKGKREEVLKSLERIDIMHYLSEEQLEGIFPGGWHRLEDEEYSEVIYIPARYEEHRHHIGVYAGNGADSTIVRGDAPNRLLDKSMISPSLAAYVIDAKYTNALPLNRISEDFKRNGLEISKQVLANWIIKLHGYYLEPVYRKLKEWLLKSILIHCDETPFKMIGKKDDGDPVSKDYMWLFYAPCIDGSPPIYIFWYDNGSRGTAAARKFLGDYCGMLLTDGYQTYHTLANEMPDDQLEVAGCWAHCRRKFFEIVNAAVKGAPLSATQKIAKEAVDRISAIYHTDHMVKGRKAEEIIGHRQQSVKPLVDSFFAWVKDTLARLDLDSSSKLTIALNYAVNQEKYLRVFLEYPYAPLDNNAAERGIRKFCVGKHSWHVIGSKKGSYASACMYSLVETAKANGLIPRKYIEYLLENLRKYPHNGVPDDELEKLMPWSDEIPDDCRMK